MNDKRIIMEFAGGLGNQMFQYAFYKSMIKRGKDIKCIITNDPNSNLPFKLNIFPNVSFNEADIEEYNKRKEKYNNRNIFTRGLNRLFSFTSDYYVENEEKSYDSRLYKTEGKIIFGYYQGLDYFKDIVDDIRKDFTFPFGEKKLCEVLNSLPEKSVSIHIRRGDYLKFSKIYGNICTDAYYNKAIEYFNNLDDFVFIVFSNDISWVKNNFVLNNAIYIEPNMFSNYQDWYDMCIMSKCTNNIIANSTFSWWGAWLNSNDKKIVITPPYFDNLHKNKNLIEKEWVIIDGTHNE